MGEGDGWCVPKYVRRSVASMICRHGRYRRAKCAAAATGHRPSHGIQPSVSAAHGCTRAEACRARTASETGSAGCAALPPSDSAWRARRSTGGGGRAAEAPKVSQLVDTQKAWRRCRCAACVRGRADGRGWACAAAMADWAGDPAAHSLERAHARADARAAGPPPPLPSPPPPTPPPPPPHPLPLLPPTHPSSRPLTH